MKIDYRDIGARIRTARTAKGMTQAALSEAAGIEPSNLSHIERAATKVSLPTLVAIANALEVSLDELVCGSLRQSTHISSKAVEEVLAGCTPAEQRVLAEFLKNAVASFRKFGEAQQ